MVECSVCGSPRLSTFFRAERSVVGQNFIYRSRGDALGAARGDIALAVCERCGFIANVAFDPTLVTYSSSYENTQTCSEVFRAYIEELAAYLVDRYDLNGKSLIEVGCGKGDFLRIICRLGGNRGVGFDPSYVPTTGPPDEDLTFVQDFYGEQHAGYRADLMISRHVLEHVPSPHRFVESMRPPIKAGGALFIEIPDSTWILRFATFWDVFYEHCSYFSPASIAYLLSNCGFDVLQVSDHFSGQYLWVEAKLASGAKRRSGNGAPVTADEDAHSTIALTESFDDRCTFRRAHVDRVVSERLNSGRRLVAWGAGAKCVTLLNTLDLGLDDIPYVVDINPKKQGGFIPGTGQEIVSPASLRDLGPDTVLVMNANYAGEIESELARLGLSAEIVSI
jgi:SAM-dependent methyltransferase